MTTREQIIAAAKGAGFIVRSETQVSWLEEPDDMTPAESLYTLAFEAGRQEEREACAATCEDGEPTSFDGYGIQLAIAIRARGDSK